MATAGGISNSQVLEITKCSICQESFTVPKVLPCIHTFCLHCLEKYGEDRKPGDKVSCPLCKREFKLELGFKELPNNYFILQLLQFNQQSTSKLTTGQLVACDLCCDLNEKLPATEYCIECGQNICQPCGTRHGKQRVSKGHNVVSFKDKPSTDERIRLALSYCEKHPNKEIEFYCYDCKKIACVICYVDHKLSQHKCAAVKESAKEFCIQLKSDIETMRPYISMRLDELKQLEENKIHLEDKIEATRKKIDIKYNQFKSLLDTHRSQLNLELDSFQSKTLKELETRKEEVERQLVIMESFKTYSEEMAKKGKPSDISRDASYLHARTEELVMSQQEFNSIATKLSPVVIKFSTPFYVTSNMIGQMTFEVPLPVPVTEESIACMPVKDFSFQSTSFLDQSSVVHVMPANRGGAWGVAVIGCQVFVARNAETCIDVYDSSNFSLAPVQLTISESKLKSPRLAACSHYNCLYVSTSGSTESVIYQFKLENSSSTNWTVMGDIKSLSVAHTYNLLVTLGSLNDYKRIHEYSRDGSLIREIHLDKSISLPVYCIQLLDGNFLISHGGVFSEHHGICLVDPSGQILHFYDRSFVGQRDCPYHLTVDKHNHVFVADCCNNRVQLLSPTLTHLGNIKTPGHQLNRPGAIQFDKISHRLYVGVVDGRVLVIECKKP